MIYANTEEIYNELYTQLQAIASTKQIEYFEKNWHPIKSKWVAYYRKNIVTHCTCREYNNLLLPCKHIFFCRNLKNIPLFDKTLIINR